MAFITSIIRQMNQGYTAPYLCQADDGHKYIVKGLSTTYKGLIYEWVCGKLGQSIGLPIPDCEIVYIDSALLEYDNYALTEGEWFASQYIENIQDITFNLLDNVDSEQLKLLFLFDYWIKNADRTLTNKGGNPNLFIKGDLETCIVLDHNLAFDPDYDDLYDQTKMLHVGSTAWFSTQTKLLTPLDKEKYQTLLENSLDQLEYITSFIPEEWLANCEDNGILNYIRATLSRINAPDFWEGIR
ncbi:HipA family kinase [Celerinatantimonas sp. YJH-8]|uniref:HipA family kinase n=1 Tax=Celerinatantimonas sp. YJH-8 TaxID=3228714 RepID=UPI0038CB2094